MSQSENKRHSSREIPGSSIVAARNEKAQVVPEAHAVYGADMTVNDGPNARALLNIEHLHLHLVEHLRHQVAFRRVRQTSCVHTTRTRHTAHMNERWST